MNIFFHIINDLNLTFFDFSNFFLRKEHNFKLNFELHSYLASSSTKKRAIRKLDVQTLLGRTYSRLVVLHIDSNQFSDWIFKHKTFVFYWLTTALNHLYLLLIFLVKKWIKYCTTLQPLKEKMYFRQFSFFEIRNNNVTECFHTNLLQLSTWKWQLHKNFFSKFCFYQFKVI